MNLGQKLKENYIKMSQDKLESDQEWFRDVTKEVTEKILSGNTYSGSFNQIRLTRLLEDQFDEWAKRNGLRFVKSQYTGNFYFTVADDYS